MKENKGKKSFTIKPRGLLYLIAFFSTSLFLYLQVKNPIFISERIEPFTVDYRFHLRNLFKKPEVPDNILIVAIDEKSIKLFGRWYWPRDLQSKLIRKILDQNPKVLTIDIFYSERENEKNDRDLARVLQSGRDRIVLAQAFEVMTGKSPKDKKIDFPVPDYITDSAFMNVKDTRFGKDAVIADGILLTIPEIGKNITFGHVYNLKDADGKTRWEVFYLKYGEDYYPSLALQTARIALGIPQEKMVLYAGRGIEIGERFIPFDPFGGRVHINYLGKEKTFDYISAADVLLDRVSSDRFRDRIVFLGTSALATYDLINTPFSANMPGVEKNATVLENIINQRLLTKSPGTIELIIIIITGLFFGFILPRLKALKGTLISFSCIILYQIILMGLFIYKGFIVNMTYPVTNMLVIFTGITITKYFYEEKRAKEIRGLFSSYVSPKIVEKLLEHPDNVKLGGERKTITVLFSDIRGFTKISEKLPPEEVVNILNEYFNDMVDIVFRWDGTLDKFVGDAIMAFWGAPVEQPNHAELALRCALHMSDRLSKLQEKWKAEGKESLDCGIGINSGEVVIGNIGAMGKKMDYTAIGDPVNLCARVESLSREYNTRIILTEFTLEILRPLIKGNKFGHLELIEIGAVKVKGKEKDVRIFGLKSITKH